MNNIEYSAEYNLQDTVAGDTIDSFTVKVDGVQVDDVFITYRHDRLLECVSGEATIEGDTVVVHDFDTSKLQVGKWNYYLQFNVGGRLRTYLHGSFNIVRGGKCCK